jgi:tripartite-type tricarboxylate transporter receptor subunit TctC
LTAWNGLMAPARTPKPIVDRIAAEVARAIRDNAFAGRLSGLGLSHWDMAPPNLPQ